MREKKLYKYKKQTFKNIRMNERKRYEKLDYYHNENEHKLYQRK